jgi:hypothetical protein
MPWQLHAKLILVAIGDRTVMVEPLLDLGADETPITMSCDR